MNDLQNYFDSCKYLIPEFCLVFSIIMATLWNLFVPKHKEWTSFWSILGLVAAMGFMAPQFALESQALFGGLFTLDRLTVGFGLLSCFVGIIVILMTVGYEHHLGRNRGEFYAILLTAVLAVMLLAGSTDLIMLFVSLETLSICCVLLAGFSKTDPRSSEAALKYLLSTAATTATLLYGLSFIYGLTGSTNFAEIHEKFELLFATSRDVIGLIFLLVLLLSAVGFKLSMVPFHMWTPDVYEGAPTPVTAFLSIGSKAGGFVVALRLITDVFSKASQEWILVVSVLAMLSMIVGNLVALAQKSFKRMLAYSSIAHVGYILIGIVANNHEGLSAMFYYIIVYGFMNLGAFAGAIMFSNETGSDNIDDYAGLIRKRPLLALGIGVCLLNLAGLPIPPAGFFAKFFIFWSGLGLTTPMGTLTIGTTPVAVTLGGLVVAVALITSVPAIFYYSRVVIKMIVKPPSELVEALPQRRAYIDSPQEAPALALAVCLIVITATGTTFIDPVMKFSRESVRPLISAPEGQSPLGLWHDGGTTLPAAILPGSNNLFK
ncbi:MAG TPA: NADH-quinone oxidoreductase subunit NuoN [Candidatus Obscuribacterales bacterium]